MKFFRNFFGEKPRPEPTQPQPPVQEQAKPPAKTIEGELPQKNFTPESRETPRIIQAEQYRYGKLLQSPGGPIVAGSEHGSTGKSTKLPEGTAIHPRKLFTHNFGQPENYPWQDEGGEIVKRLVEKNGQQYVVAARRMMHSEAGENKPGRMYTEMHEIVIPAAEWSIALVPQLSNILEAKSATETNDSLPTIELKTDNLDQPLPENWFDDYVQELISNVVSGQALALQDWDVTEKDFLQKLFYTLTCLPENIARQISFGAGLAHAEEGEVRIAHTKTALGLRKIGGQWKGTTAEDTKFGEKYLMTIRQTISECKTPRQVMVAVNNIPTDIKEEIEKRFQQ